MTVTSHVALVVTCLTALALLVYICWKNGKANIGGIVDRATREAAYTATEFIIYDKSSSAVCDRLIVVRPFDWTVWAFRGELYILNPEGGATRSGGTTAAVRLFDGKFYETSLTLSYDAIINAYSRKNGAKVKHVPYAIEGRTFTVLTALGLLAKKWITFDDTRPDSKVGRLTYVEPSTPTPRSGGATGRAMTPHQLARYVGTAKKDYLTSAELDNVYTHLARR